MKIGTLQNLSIHCHIGLDPVNNSSPYHKPALEENSSASSEEGFEKKIIIIIIAYKKIPRDKRNPSKDLLISTHHTLSIRVSHSLKIKNLHYIAINVSWIARFLFPR